MSVTKNFIYNSVLLISQYLIPIIIYPYISRIFGVDKIGIVNWVDNTINYFILFSMLGLTLTGIRETAKHKNDIKMLSNVFAELIIIHMLLTLFITIVYIYIILNNDKFNEHKNLYFIGVIKLIFNVFLIEWYFRGTENFKFILNRSIIIKIIYVISIFIFVKRKEDYTIYFTITCLITLTSAIVNCWYAFKEIKFSFKRLNIQRHLKTYFTVGIYLILTSMYTTFNITYLGLVSNDISVGYYTTALKLYTIILGIFSALNTVVIPKLSSLIAEKKYNNFDELVDKSLTFIITLSFPVIICGITLAPQIILLLSGPGFEKSIICFRIIIPLIFIVGIAQILSNQILMSIKKDKELAYISLFGALVGITLNVLLVPKLREVGTSLVVLISELLVTATLYALCKKITKLKFPLNNLKLNILASLPYFFICRAVINNIKNTEFCVILSAIICAIYFIFSQKYLIKNKVILNQMDKIKILYINQ
ncbi:oligosaccharide flippase family protein [Spirosoma humi]